MPYGDYNATSFATLEFIHTKPNEVGSKYELAKKANETHL
jgi:hypothetical protein